MLVKFFRIAKAFLCRLRFGIKNGGSFKFLFSNYDYWFGSDRAGFS